MISDGPWWWWWFVRHFEFSNLLKQHVTVLSKPVVDLWRFTELQCGNSSQLRLVCVGRMKDCPGLQSHTCACSLTAINRLTQVLLSQKRKGWEKEQGWEKLLVLKLHIIRTRNVLQSLYHCCNVIQIIKAIRRFFFQGTERERVRDRERARERGVCDRSARQPLGTQHTPHPTGTPYSNKGSYTHPNTPQIPMKSLLTRIIFSDVFIQAC